MSDIPRHWSWVVVGEVSSVTGGLTQNSKREDLPLKLPFLRVANVYANELRLAEVSQIGLQDSEVSRALLKRGDLLVVEGNGSLDQVGRVAIWNGVIDPCLHQNHLIKVRFSPLELGRFAMYWFLSTAGRDQIIRVASSTSGLHTLSISKIEALQLPVAPLAEQDRIVEAIESHFTRLDDAMATLKRAELNLKRYRASVLKAAVEGRLVPTEAALAKEERRTYEPASALLQRILTERRRRWSESGKKSKYEEPTPPNTDSLPELPEGWCWSSVEQITTGERSSGYGVLVPGPDVPDGVLLVRVGDIYDGLVHLEGMKRISRDIADQFQRTYLKGGELLLSLVGSIGRTAVVPEMLAGANVARAVGVVPVSKLLDCRWVEHWFRSPANQARMVGLSHEVARKTLNLEDVRSAVVAIPPGQEQTRIVEAVGGLESLTNKSTSLVELSRQRAARLRQAILKWAFEGKLADQDTNDEPASVLLERIKTERAAAETKPTAPKRDAKKKQVRA